MKSSLGNVSVSLLNTEQTLETLWHRIQLTQKTRIFFMNAHNYNIAQKDNYYKDCLNNAEIVLNDGIGIELGAKLFGVRFEENMNGSDFGPVLLRKAQENQLSAYLLGAAPGVADRAAANIKDHIAPGLNIKGTHHGFFKDSSEIVRMINEANVDMLIVGMGVPLQEKWITDHYELLNVKIIVAIGAYIDFAAESVRRAPNWMRVIRMEWFFRLLIEPRRLWRRYLIGNFMFFIYIIKNRMGGKPI